jgi:hypothetical protein
MSLAVRGGTSRRIHLGVAALVVAAETVVSAPYACAGEWEIEVHGIGLATATPSSGRTTTLPPGNTFQTAAPGVISLRVSSWYFGEGGNQIEYEQPGYVSGPGYNYQYTQKVGPLDPVLASAAVDRPFAAGGGLRLGRRLGHRFSAEFNLEYGGHAPTFTKDARDGIDLSRFGFENAWKAKLSSLPGSTVSSQTTLVDGSGHQLTATAVVNINLQTGDAPKWSRRPPRRRSVSYITLGAGLTSVRGEEARATLVGRYQFSAPTGVRAAPFDETDTVIIRSASSFGTHFVGVVGLGCKNDLTDHMGLRLDARAYLSQNTTRIVMDARPSMTEGSPPSTFVLPSTGAAAIQFVNSASDEAAGHYSSLSGPPIASFETFKGTGVMLQINLSLGVFLRF